MDGAKLISHYYRTINFLKKEQAHLDRMRLFGFLQIYKTTD